MKRQKYPFDALDYIRISVRKRIVCLQKLFRFFNINFHCKKHPSVLNCVVFCWYCDLEYWMSPIGSGVLAFDPQIVIQVGLWYPQEAVLPRRTNSLGNDLGVYIQFLLPVCHLYSWCHHVFPTMIALLPQTAHANAPVSTHVFRSKGEPGGVSTSVLKDNSCFLF